MTTVDAWPAEATLRPVEGDPFAFRLVLRDAAGGVVDVSLYEWRATVTTGRIRLDFEAYPDEGGVRLVLRGEDTARLYAERAGRPCPYDVACRQPSAGEGAVVLAGDVLVKRRVTDPPRHDPDLVPHDENLVPA